MMMTKIEIKVWEEIARRKLAGQLTPSIREICSAIFHSQSSVHLALIALEDYDIICRPIHPGGYRMTRAIELLIWPASFGIGANKGLSK